MHLKIAFILTFTADMVKRVLLLWHWCWLVSSTKVIAQGMIKHGSCRGGSGSTSRLLPK